MTTGDLTRPIVGIENRTAAEVFDIMCDRIRHARAQAGEPVAWQHRYVFRGASEMPWRDGRAPTSSPFAPEDECYSDYKVEERALYTHPAPAQEPVAVPAGEPIRSAKGEGIPEVIYVSSPVIKWPNAVLSGTWESRPDERCSVRFAAAVSPPADRPQQFMSDKTRQFVEPVRKMLAEGINVQALGEATNQIIEGAFRSLVGHIDELEMDLAALRTAVALASTPAPQPFDPATSPGMTDIMADPDTLGAFMEANPLPEEPAPLPGGAVKVRALEWSPVEHERSNEDPTTEIVGYEANTGFWCHYSVEITGGGASLTNPEYSETEHASPEAAKAAAQADYEHRILSALSPSPSGWDAGAEATREKCAAAVGPTGGRPCDCERCDCRNRDDAERVARWDEAKACADAIRALPLPTPAGEG